MEKRVEGKLKKAFYLSFVKFLLYLMIFQSSVAPRMCSTLKIIKYGEHNWQNNEENPWPCSTCLKPISPWYYMGTQTRVLSNTRSSTNIECHFYFVNNFYSLFIFAT